MSGSKSSVKIKSPKNKNTIFGLPSKSYTDNEFWEKECNTALSDGWLFVAFVHEFSKVGDVVRIFIAGKPILLVKNENKGKNISCLLVATPSRIKMMLNIFELKFARNS